MLKLVNIVKNNNFIEADYIPESSNKKAHAKLNLITDEISAEIIEEYGSMYSRMAVNGLKRILDEINVGKIGEIPKERIVMWY